MRFDKIGTEVWIALGILFLLSTQSPGFLGLMVLIGMGVLFRAMSENPRQERGLPLERRTYNDAYDEIEPVVEPDHVLEAIKTAGHDANKMPVLPVDLGFMVYKDDKQPEIHRTQPIEDDIDYVRPFVELDLPRAVKGRIKFEILDSSGQVMFVDETQQELKQGTQPIIASTWLPIHDAHDLNGMWQLKVYAEDMLLANHVFEWAVAPEPSAIREHIQEDGEISPELRQVMADNKLQRMSLDELLAHQDEEDQPSNQRSQRR